MHTDAIRERPLLAQLHDTDRNVRANTVVELGKLGDRATATVLVEALATEPDFFIREYLTWSIVRVADAATPLLIRMLRDARAQARHGAAHTLGKIADPRATAALTAALQDDDPIVVSKAAFALGAIGAVEAAPALSNLLGGENRELESTLVSVFDRLGSPAIPAVLDALTRPTRACANTPWTFWASSAIRTASPPSPTLWQTPNRACVSRPSTRCRTSAATQPPPRYDRCAKTPTRACARWRLECWAAAKPGRRSYSAPTPNRTRSAFP
jgi:HEAT repeat protein